MVTAAAVVHLSSPGAQCQSRRLGVQPFGPAPGRSNYDWMGVQMAAPPPAPRLAERRTPERTAQGHRTVLSGSEGPSLGGGKERSTKVAVQMRMSVLKWGP